MIRFVKVTEIPKTVIHMTQTPNGYVELYKRGEVYTVIYDDKECEFTDKNEAEYNYNRIVSHIRSLDAMQHVSSIMGEILGSVEQDPYSNIINNIANTKSPEILNKVSGYLDYLISLEADGSPMVAEAIRAYVKQNL